MNDQYTPTINQAPGPAQGPWQRWVVLSTLGGLLLATYSHLESVAMEGQRALLESVINEMTGVWGATLLLYCLVPFLMRYPLGQPTRGAHIPLHGAAIVGYSIAHTSLNWSSRFFLYPLFGLGSYDYGKMPTRYFMELPIDIIGYSVALILVGLMQRREEAREGEIQILRLEEQLKSAKLSGLQAQLRPHFLFNALNTISSVMHDDVEKADEVLQSLSDLLRKMVDEGDRTLVPLAEELALVKNYASIMGARFSEKLHVVVEVPDDHAGALSAWPVPPLLLQPLVENAIQHGGLGSQDSLRIVVSAFLREEDGNPQAIVEVSDNGIGISKTYSAGVGLNTTSERLRTLYGNRAALSLRQQETGGTRVSVRIPKLASHT